MGLRDFYSFHWNIYTNYKISVDTIDEWRQNIDINARNLAYNGPHKIRPDRNPKFAKITAISRLSAWFKNLRKVCKLVKVATVAKYLQL